MAELLYGRGDIKTATAGMSRSEYQIMRAKEAVSGIKEIVDEKKHTKPIMLVDDYIEKFLPCHLGIYQSEQDESLNQWIDFAGSVFDEVDLIKDDGSYFATVPSIYPENVLTQSTEIREDEVPLGNKIRYLQSIAQTYQGMADEAQKTLFLQVGSKLDKDVIETHRKKWMDFFIKMGIFDSNGKLNTIATDNTPQPKQTYTKPTEDQVMFVRDDD